MTNDEQQNALVLDYKLQTSEERTALVQKIIDNASPEQLTNAYLEHLANYILYIKDKEERKKSAIITENRKKYTGTRETSFQGLADKLENGEDGIYNMITNDKNIIFMPKVEITEKDKAEIPALKELCDAIDKMEAAYAKSYGKKKFKLKQQIIEMRKDQYVIKNSYRKPIYLINAIKSFNQLDLAEDACVDENGEIVSDAAITFFEPKHVSAMLCNYSKLKEDSYGRFWSDSYYLMIDLDALIERTLAKDPLLKDLLIYKIDGKMNTDIQSLLNEKYGVRHSIEYISSLWRNKIPKMISEQAKKEFLNWYYTEIEKGKFKKCSRCGQIKLAHNKFFSKNSTSKDGFYSICKDCRNKK